jgi:hypothetical protein
VHHNKGHLTQQCPEAQKQNVDVEGRAEILSCLQQAISEILSALKVVAVQAQNLPLKTAAAKAA